MKKGKRRIILRPHFIKRWRQRIGPRNEQEIKKRLEAALKNKTIYGFMRDTFIVEIEGRRAVCIIDGTGVWVFLTLLDPWMYNGRVERRLEAYEVDRQARRQISGEAG